MFINHDVAEQLCDTPETAMMDDIEGIPCILGGTRLRCRFERMGVMTRGNL
jgi:hypothetical protein